MGRPERSIDPEAGPVAEFARDLRRLRDSAGRPSYRELARKAGFSVTVLSDAAGGQRLPTLPVVKGYVGACGGDLADWEQRWKCVAEQRRARSADFARPAPYMGLASYGVEDADLYFGREALASELLERLRRGRFLAVFGPSGSGKSSLLRAGVLAALQRGDAESTAGWETLLLTPGEQPLASLAGHVAELSGIAAQRVLDGLRSGPEGLSAPLARVLEARPLGAEVVLVVDQFEELFTVCRDSTERDHFVHALLAAAASDEATLQGSGPLTRINYLGTGACLSMHDPNKDGANPAKNSSGSLRGFFIDGTSAIGTAYGIDIGDGWAYRLDHLFVDNFTAPGSVGLRLVNNAFFTEKLVATAVTVRNCATQVLMHHGNGDNSFEYCDLAFYFAIHPGQDGLVIDNGAYLAGGSLMIRGNTYSQKDSASQGYVIRVGTDTSGSGDGSTINSCRLDVAIEQNNFASGFSYVPGTVYFSGSSNTMLNDYGMLHSAIVHGR